MFNHQCDIIIQKWRTNFAVLLQFYCLNIFLIEIKCVFTNSQTCEMKKVKLLKLVLAPISDVVNWLNNYTGSNFLIELIGYFVSSTITEYVGLVK